ncbi:MAG: glycoside hydrolase family 3 protein [Actinophytocola sp.]|uniref:glycoside hydrolase family 3 protein n=1 Tax=Actinophytocola sp. TaxID=1872138 RepID=UPI0013282A3A|nr:glycoside hydrolase family 3 protein [Actinophytocola sp.]MPZ82051.1 glycoside hydrolase family 3 protein [Actinophytocola sp.]
MSRTSARRSLSVAIAVVASSAMVSGVSQAAVSGNPQASNRGADAAALAQAKAHMHGMSLDQKIAQLFVVSVWGKSANEAHPTNQANYGVDTPAQVIEKFGVGGVIYFNNSGTDNVDNPEQLAAFSNGLQRAAVKHNTHLPLIVAIDQEGGNVTRLESPATEFPASMAVGAGRSSADAKTVATINARELRAMGINQNFAPVADVNSNPLNPVIGARSFSSRPDLASRLVTAEIDGYQEGGRLSETVSSAAKHFPGHGDAETDSHTGLPNIDRTEAEWREFDLPPFKAAVDAGIDSIMTAHIEVPSLDPTGVPATLSKPILTGLLRNELHYRGVIVTDALGMGGANVFPPEEIPVMALEAGVDQLLMPPDLQLAIDSVKAAVESGRLTERRIDESVLRILLLKLKRGILTSPFVNEHKVDKIVGTPANVAKIQQIMDRTTTVVRNDAGLLPIADVPANVLVTGIGDTTSGLTHRSPEWLAASIDERGADATPLPTGLNPNQATIDRAVTAANGADLVVVLTNNLSGRLQQRALVNALLATGKPVVAVASQIPYDAGFVDAPTWVATYGWRANAMESLTKVLFGEVSPKGTLPVDIPTGDDPNTVLYPFGTGLTW